LLFSPDAQFLAVATSNDNVNLWNLTNTKSPVWSVHGYVDIQSMAFSPDGRLLSIAHRSASSTGQDISLLDTSSGALMTSLQTTSWVDDQAFSPDGRLLATSGDHGLISFWGVPANP
jgi:WD40 repeat protein